MSLKMRNVATSARKRRASHDPERQASAAVHFNEMKLSVAVVGHVANEVYADTPSLRDLCLWFPVLPQGPTTSGSACSASTASITALSLMSGRARQPPINFKDFVRLVKPLRAECGTKNRGAFAQTSFLKSFGAN